LSPTGDPLSLVISAACANGVTLVTKVIEKILAAIFLIEFFTFFPGFSELTEKNINPKKIIARL
jgi:hypothetical protein